MGLFDKIFGNYSEKQVKKVMPIVEKINGLETEIEKLTDKELTAKTAYFKEELAKKEKQDSKYQHHSRAELTVLRRLFLLGTKTIILLEYPLQEFLLWAGKMVQ